MEIARRLYQLFGGKIW